MKKTTRPTGERRRRAIMDAAWALFMEKGYAAASIDDIVREAGGSKSSVYGFFGGKEGLFYAIIKEVTDRILSDFELPDTEGVPPREALRIIGMAFGRNILSEKAISLFGLSASVSKELPQTARLFYEAGPRTAHRALAVYLKKETEAGVFKIKDPMRAAEIFSAIVLEPTHLAMSLNCKTAPSQKELDKTVNEAVEVFLAAYGR